MQSLWRRVLVSLVLATVVIGFCVSSETVGKPKDNEPLGGQTLNMNDHTSWKDADSYRREGPDYTMDMDVAVLWNSDDNRPGGGDGWGDFAQVEEYRGLTGLVDASIYCYGTYDPNDIHHWSEIALWIWKAHTNQWVREPAIKACSDYWQTNTWTVDFGPSGSYATYFRFVLFRQGRFVKFGPKDSWSPLFTHDDGALIEIDPHQDPTKWDANYYFMMGTTFSDVDSCGDYASCAPEWHSEVNNFVVFTEYNDYFQTDTFYAPGDRMVYFYLHAKCLTTPFCMIAMYIDGVGVGTYSFAGGWAEVPIHGDWLTHGSHTFKVQNLDYEGGESHFAWDYLRTSY